MANFPTLRDILLTQDMGEKGADKICDDVLNDSFNANKDVVSAVIVRAFVDNDYSDYESMNTDLKYAINQLTKAQKMIEANIK